MFISVRPMSVLYLPSNIYEEDLNNETTLDMSSQQLQNIPKINIELLCSEIYRFVNALTIFKGLLFKREKRDFEGYSEMKERKKEINFKWMDDREQNREGKRVRGIWKGKKSLGTFTDYAKYDWFKNNRFTPIFCERKVLYLQDNQLTSLSDDFFPSLPNLKYLDLRNNQINCVPHTIENHQCLTHLLLQNNKITSLPNELGTVSLKVLHISGNPLTYPPKIILSAGTSKILTFLKEKYMEDIINGSRADSDEISNGGNGSERFSQGVVSYNSVIDGIEMKNNALCVQLNEKDSQGSDEEYYAKVKGKCPKLSKSRTEPLPAYYQSSKYLKPLRAECGSVQEENLKRSFLADMALKKHKELLAARDKILQDRKNVELLKAWRQSYQHKKQFANANYRLDPKNCPYDTNPEYMTLLTRQEIEKDLPDKYKKRLTRKCKPTVPRKSNKDVHLAMKIKKLFENLEAIDLNREGMTPRTEQRILLNEIKKITEIKEKLMELSATNTKSVEDD